MASCAWALPGFLAARNTQFESKHVLASDVVLPLEEDVSFQLSLCWNLSIPVKSI